MSYEGYYVCYCKNGHRITVRDCYDDMPEKCDVCGETKMMFDSVNQTNGCECEDNTCPAHEKITEKDIIKYDPLICRKCNGLGYVDSKNYMVICCCTDPKCPKCFGTGKEYLLTENSAANEPCDICHGRGKIFVEVYDLSKISHHGS